MLNSLLFFPINKVMNNTQATVLFIVCAYAIHFFINVFVYQCKIRNVMHDVLRFGVEFSLVGLCFWGTAILDKHSAFNNNSALTDSQEKVLIAVLISFGFIIFEILSVFFYKKYITEKNRLKTPSSAILRFILFSYISGIVEFGAGLTLMWSI